MVDRKSVSLGLDVSTSVVGIALVGDDLLKAPVALRSIELSGIKGGLWEKARSVKDIFADIAIEFDVSQVFIEQNLSGFRPGFSSAHTILLLARFNGIVSWLALEAFGSDPKYVDFTKARSALGIKVLSEKACHVSVKEQIWQQVSSSFQWPWRTRILRSGPRKGECILDPTHYDEIDALVVCKSGIMHPDTIV